MIGKKNKSKEKKDRFRFSKKIFHRLKNSKAGMALTHFIEWLFKKIEKSIRFELMCVFAICFLVSFTFYSMMDGAFDKVNTHSEINYDYGDMKSYANTIVSKLKPRENYNGKEGIKSLQDKENIMSVLKEGHTGNSKIYLTDLDGKVLYSVNGNEEKLDIYGVIDKSNSEIEDGNEKMLIYPVKIGQDRSYLIYSKIPTPYIHQESYVQENNFFALILSVFLFIITFIIITNRKMKYLDEIAKGVKIISSGNLSYRINEKGKDEIKNLAENINVMAREIEKGIDKEREAEKTKNELITNVSHDLRTPLTSVMGYIGLIKDGKYEDENTMKEYLDIAFNKSNQLKELIQDLFEYTKLNNTNIELEKSNVNLVEFLSQIIEEYIPVFEENNLTVIKRFVDDSSIVNIDAGKIARVFENLFSNAIKYSFKPGEVIISSYENNGYVNIVIKNKGENIPKEKVDKLFDRFYRGDEARNSNVKGSGLGLAITKNIIELHKGKIWADCVGNDISFFIKLECVK